MMRIVSFRGHWSLIHYVILFIYSIAILFKSWLYETVIKLKFAYSMFPRSTHETFAQKMYRTFQKHKRFRKPKLSPTNFTVSHYAGDVSIKGRVLLLVCQNYDSWIYALLIYFSGHISNWFILGQEQRLLGQEQRLCCCWTSSPLKCFRMYFCSWFVSTSIRWIIKIEVLIDRNTA